MAGVLAGVASSLRNLRFHSLFPASGIAFGFKCGCIMAIGGFGNVLGALIGGMTVGLMEAVVMGFGGGAWVEMVAWNFLVLVYVVRRGGLLKPAPGVH